MSSFKYRLPFKRSGAGRRVDNIATAELVPSSRWSAVCRRWDHEVMGEIAAIAGRADGAWRWDHIAQLMRFYGALRVPILVQIRMRRDVPIAMMVLLANECWVEDSSERAVFLWYLSTAPDAYLTRRLGFVPKMVGRMAVHVGLRISQGAGSHGRLWLHAAKSGQDLPRWYGSAGATWIPENTFPHLPGFRLNDGRYFAYTDQTAEWILRDLDHLTAEEMD